MQYESKKSINVVNAYIVVTVQHIFYLQAGKWDLLNGFRSSTHQTHYGLNMHINILTTYLRYYRQNWTSRKHFLWDMRIIRWCRAGVRLGVWVLWLTKCRIRHYIYSAISIYIIIKLYPNLTAGDESLSLQTYKLFTTFIVNKVR